MADQKYFGWYQFEDAMMDIAQQIEARQVPDGIVSIGRGGYPGGVILSYHFNIPLGTINAKHYQGREMLDRVTIGDAPITKGDILVVDEIVDSGRTLSTVLEALRDSADEHDEEATFQTAAIHVKGDSAVQPDYWVEMTDEWIVYPWESAE